MNFGAEIFAASVAVAIVACFAGRYLSQQKLLKGRQPIPINEIVDDLPENIGRDEASEVLQAIAKSFGLQPENLRLEDPISALTKIDSWMLGKGQESFECWLRNKGIRSLQTKPSSIRDLIIYVVQSHISPPI